MAIVLSIQKWKHYLMGRRFIVHTDQKSLEFLLDQREVTMDYQKWLIKLFLYDFQIVYKQGSENKAADRLSRIHHPVLSSFALQFFALTVPSVLQLQDLYKEIAEDDELQSVIAACLADPNAHPHHKVVEGRLWYKNRLVLPPSSSNLSLLLEKFYCSLMGGHSGVLKILKRLRKSFYWKGMLKDVHQFAAKCGVCQTHKYSTLSPAGLLQPLPLPQQVWKDINMDFAEGLPTSHGINVIFVVVVCLSKYGHFIGMKHPFTAADVAKKFILEVVRLHGFPASIV